MVHDPSRDGPSQTPSSPPPTSLLYDLLFLGALLLAAEPLLALGHSVGMGELPWRESRSLGALLLLIYVVHVVGLTFKFGPLSQRIYNRAPPGKRFDDRFKNLILGPPSGLLLLLMLPLLSQFVLWFFLLGTSFQMLGWTGESNLLDLLLFFLGLLLTIIPVGLVWRLFSIDEGRSEPLPELPHATFIEAIGDILLAVAAILLLLPMLPLIEDISEAMAAQPDSLLCMSPLLFIFGSVFYAAPRLPHLLEELPHWQFWVRSLVIIGVLLFNFTSGI